MKYLIINLIFCVIVFDASAQNILPFNYLKKGMIKSTVFMQGDEGDKRMNSPFGGGVFFPSTKETKLFQNEPPSLLSTNNITYNDSLSNISMYSELASDYFGPVRVSIGTTLSYPKTDSSTIVQQKLNREKYIQRFATGGGSLIFNFALPIYAYQSKIFITNVTFSPKFSVEPPSFGVSSNTFSNNTSIGAEMQVGFYGAQDLISFFAYTRIAYTNGNSAFYNALLLIDDNRKGFWLNTFTVGVNVKDLFSISYQKFFGSHNIADKLTGYLTFSISPNFK